MNFLLDTHAFLWTVTNDSRLSTVARDVIADGGNEIFLSAVSMWEIVLKASVGKLRVEGGPARFLQRQIRLARLSTLPIHPAHILQLPALPPLHKDPFDRLLIAQAQVEDLPLITSDPAIRRYQVHVVW